MTWTNSQAVASQLPGILRSAADVQAFVQHLIMQAVFDVLEQQGRSAGLVDGVIASILNQLTVTITYQPLHCQMVVVDPKPDIELEYMMMMPESCFVLSGTLTNLCRKTAANKKCKLAELMDITLLPEEYKRFSGTITTTNIIMTNWSTRMWQSLLNRVVRALASGPFATNFVGVSATIRGS
ncbi:hypothetical protein KIN20_015271 [Parelaphostrongylus tenuis]|uniref:Uncharacterized protein n=1 Tax=Parelaphostrongylus tenuis TaxID=148309 RepID=A0AAD5QPU4_PARTN|nr:hypothetical protein KIN20_015271 [Parelaphostrongylus tenuis]